MDEREFELVNIIGGPLGSSQRELSRQMALSLGMTNMLVRRLVAKGYIRIQQLNKKKVHYILTPKGFSEKMRKSVKYTVKTLHSIVLVKKHLTVLIQREYDAGVRQFYVLGASDLAGLIGMVISESGWQDITVVAVETPEQARADGVLLVCREKTDTSHVQGVRAVNVIEAIARSEVFTGSSLTFDEGVLHA